MAHKGSTFASIVAVRRGGVNSRSLALRGIYLREIRPKPRTRRWRGAVAGSPPGTAPASAGDPPVVTGAATQLLYLAAALTAGRRARDVVLEGRIELAGDYTVTTPPTPHLEAQLQHDIDVLQRKLQEMADLDERALTRALQSFLKGDRQLAYSVILRDQDVDAFETELDRLCIEFIVRHQPAAALLRFVYSSSKIVGALERIGDYAESIARQVLLAGSLPYDVPTEKFVEIANLAIPMLHNAMRAFLDKNADLARTTLACEPRVNQVRDAIDAQLVEWRQRRPAAARGLHADGHGGAPVRAGLGPGDQHLRGGAVRRHRANTSATGRARVSACCSWTRRTAV